MPASTNDWAKVELRELLQVDVETLTPEPDQAYMYYTVQGRVEGKFPYKEYGREIHSSKNVVKNGQLLVCKINPRISRIEFVDLDSELPQICSTEFIPFRVDESRIDPNYLMFSLRAPEAAAFFQSRASGTSNSHQRMKPRDVLDFRVPLPPLQAQKHIANILGKILVLQKARARANQLTSKIIQSIYRKMFGDPVANPKNWPVKRIGDISKVVRGSSPRPKGDRRYFGGPIPRLMIADITRDGSPVYPRIDSLTKEGAERSRFVQKGTIVVAVSGNVGLTSILGVDCCIHDGFIALLELDRTINPVFLRTYLDSIRGINLGKSSGAIWRNLTTREIRDILVHAPPIELQDKFESLVEAIGTTRKTQEQSTREIDGLFHSLMHRAFRGELRTAEITANA